MTVRYFSGMRSDNKSSIASELVRFSLLKTGKPRLPAKDHYKLLIKKHMDAHKKKALQKHAGTSRLKMSARAEAALKELAMKKAAKEEKAMRKMVIIIPKRYRTGAWLDSSGRIWNAAGQHVLTINKKNGNISTVSGGVVGKYKPKSTFNDDRILDLIERYSPRKPMLNNAPADGWDPATGGIGPPVQVVTVNGAEMLDHHMAMHGGMHGHRDLHGNDYDDNGLRQQYDRQLQQQQAELRVSGVSATAWGASSNNVHGTFGDNAWGTVSDNVWGSTNKNIWGTYQDSPAGLWGNSGGWGMMGRSSVWSSGSPNQTNYIKKLWFLISSLVGMRGTRLFGGGSVSGSGSGAGRTAMTSRGAAAPSTAPTSRSGSSGSRAPAPAPTPRGGRR